MGTEVTCNLTVIINMFKYKLLFHLEDVLVDFDMSEFVNTFSFDLKTVFVSGLT